MAKKNRSQTGGQASAPNYQILQQPAHNPYYPDPSAALLSSPPPPPYSDLTVPISSSQTAHQNSAFPMSHINSSSHINYPRINDNSPNHVPIVIQSSSIPYDRRAERYSRRVRNFNNQTMLLSFLALLFSLWAHGLYDRRTCLYDYPVHQLSKDYTVTIKVVREMHLSVAYLSGFVFFCTLAKATTGYNSKSYSCYLFLTSMFTLIGTCFTGYLAYLAFYSPCSTEIVEIFKTATKTILSSFTNNLPPPEKGVFGEKNVIMLRDDDQYGVLIFILDAVNLLFYASIFIASISTC